MIFLYNRKRTKVRVLRRREGQPDRIGWALFPKSRKWLYMVYRRRHQFLKAKMFFNDDSFIHFLVTQSIYINEKNSSNFIKICESRVIENCLVLDFMLKLEESTYIIAEFWCLIGKKFWYHRYGYDSVVKYLKYSTYDYHSPCNV